MSRALEQGEEEGPVANRSARRGLVTGDEAFVAAEISKAALQAIVGARDVRVVVTGEELGDEELRSSEHVLKREFPKRFGIPLDGLADRSQQVLEVGTNFSGGALEVQELGGSFDEAMQKAHIGGGSAGQVQGDIDVLKELTKEEKLGAPFFSPSSRASRTFRSI